MTKRKVAAKRASKPKAPSKASLVRLWRALQEHNQCGSNCQLLTTEQKYALRACNREVGR
jgi:hypothetical protein